jgi:hypothetical protein
MAAADEQQQVQAKKKKKKKGFSFNCSSRRSNPGSRNLVSLPSFLQYSWLENTEFNRKLLEEERLRISTVKKQRE